MSDKPTIDLSLSPNSQASWEKFYRQMQENRQLVQKLKRELKAVEDIGKGISRLRIQQATGGESGYARGVDARSTRRIDRTTFEGTDQGRAIMQGKEQLRLAREHTNHIRNQAQIHAAMNMDVARLRGQISQINDLKQLQSLHETTILRTGLMQSQNNKAQAADAAALNDQIQRRIAMLKQQQVLDRESHKAGAMDRSRAAQRERLTGDGGAHIMGIQASLLGNYMAIGAGLGAIYGTGRFLKDLDESLHNLQAIVVVTEGNMVGLKTTILDVAESTKFYSTELADAAVNMGQAGLSAQEIQESLKGVALLASATGTELSKSVDIMTSVLGVFNMSASQTEQIANTITQAVNDSKLSIDKLTLGLQYAGNTAAQSGVSFEELVAAMGAIANAGIRSGSTMGTGLRQLMISFQKPSKAFMENLDKLGLSMADVDLRSHGLSGAMNNLQKAGFTASDAIRSFEVRAAASFTALAGQITTMRDLEKSFVDSNAAMKANETQMSSLANRGRQLLSTLQTVAATALQPFVILLTDMTAGLTSVVQAMGPAIGVLIAFGTAWGALKAISKVSAMMAGFAGVTSTTTVAAGSAAAATTTLAVSMTRLRVAAAALSGPWGLLASLAISGGIAMYGMLRRGSDLGDMMDQLRTNFDNANGAMTTSRDEMDRVSERLADLKNKARNLTGERLDLEVSKIRQEFRDMGIVLPNTVGHVNELISALGDLRDQLSQDYILNISVAQKSLDDLILGEQAVLDNQRRSLVGNEGLHRFRRGDYQQELSNTPQIQGIDAAIQRVETALDPANMGDERMSSEAIQVMRKALKDAKAQTLSTFDQRYVEWADQWLNDYIAMLQTERNLNSSIDQRERHDQDHASALVMDANRAVADQINLLSSNVDTTFLPALDPNLTADAQAAQAEILYQQLDAQGQMLQAEIDRMVADAELIKPGSGEYVKEKLGASLAGAVANGLQAYFDALATISTGLETQLEDLENEAKLDLAAIDRQIEAETDPVQKLQYMEARRLFVDGVQADRDRLLGLLVDVAKQLDDTDKVREAQTNRLQASSDHTDTDQGYRRETAEFAQDQLEKSSSNARELVSTHDNATQRGLERLEEALKAETNIGRQNDLLNQIGGYITSRADERRELLEAAQQAAIAAGETKEAADLGTALADLEFRTQQALTALSGRRTQNEATDRGQQIADLREQITDADHAYDQRLSELGQQLEDLPAEAFDERLEIIAAMAEVRQAQSENRVDRMDEIIELLKADQSPEGQQAVADMQRQRDGELASLTEDAREFDEQARAVQIADHEEEMRLIDAAMQAVELALDRAKTQEEINRLQQEGLALLAQKAATGETLGELKRYTPGETRTAEVQHEVEVESFNNRIVSRGKDLKKDAGGSKGKKGKKEKTEQEQWIETHKNVISATQSLGERNLIPAAKVAETIATTAAAAEARLTGVDKQLMGLYDKLSQGKLTTKEQERMTELLKEQQGLLDIIETKYGNIGAKMILNGDYTAGGTLVIGEWAKEALNLEDALQKGIINTLNTGLQGTADFFSSITDGSKKGKAAFADLAVSVVKSIHQMLTQMLAMKAMMASIKWLNTSFGFDIPLPGAGMAMGGDVRVRNTGVQTGHVRKFALGGAPNRDSQLIHAQPGEYILRKTAVDAIGRDTLDEMNARGNSVVSRSNAQNKMAPTPTSEGNRAINFYLVDERSQAGALGPHDVLAVVTDDIARGGVTKKLIKSIQLGNL